MQTRSEDAEAQQHHSPRRQRLRLDFSLLFEAPVMIYNAVRGISLLDSTGAKTMSGVFVLQCPFLEDTARLKLAGKNSTDAPVSFTPARLRGQLACLGGVCDSN